MSKKRNLLIVLVALSAISCNTLKEPSVDICVVLDRSTLHCIPTDERNPEYQISISDSLGYFCASPRDYGSIKKHHDELHKRLDKGK
jgi:hypothetical protein